MHAAFEAALFIELTFQGHAVEQSRSFVFIIAVADGSVIADPKVAVAIRLNFKESGLRWQRVIRTRRDLTADGSDGADGQQDGERSDA